MEPDSPAYVKFKNSKRFDPAQSDVVKVLSEQEKGDYNVDKKAVIEARMCNGVS